MSIGAEYLASGMAAAGQGLGEGIARYREQRKRDKEIDSAYGAIGDAAEELVKQKVLPEGFLARYMEAGKGGATAKRGVIEGLGVILKYAEQAQMMRQRQASEDRSERYLNLQEGMADERAAKTSAEGRFRGELAKYMAPQTATVGAGPFAMPVPVQRRLSPEFVAGLAARHNVDAPANLRYFMADQEQGQFEPRMIELADGTKMVTTSRNSAMPLRQVAGEQLQVEDWMTGDDRELFMERIQELPIKQAKEVFQIRRQARPEEFRSGNPMEALLAAMMGGGTAAKPAKEKPQASEQSVPVLRFDKRGNPIK